jgi:hypothetical protein
MVGAGVGGAVALPAPAVLGVGEGGAGDGAGAAGGGQQASFQKERLVPAGSLRVNRGVLSLVSHSGEEIWTVPNIQQRRLLCMGGDEALLYLAFDTMLVVASIHDPSLVMLCTRRTHAPGDSQDYSRLDVFPSAEATGASASSEGGDGSGEHKETVGDAQGGAAAVALGGAHLNLGVHGMVGGLGDPVVADPMILALHGLEAPHGVFPWGLSSKFRQFA